MREIIIINTLLTGLMALYLKEKSDVQRLIGQPLWRFSLLERHHKMKKREKELAKNFYRIYKYIYLQTSVGTREEDIYKSLYQVVTTPQLKSIIFQSGVAVAQSHDAEKGIEHMKKHLNCQEGLLLTQMLTHMRTSGLSLSALQRLDRLMFQKYIQYIRGETEAVKQKCFYAIVLMTLAITLLILAPLVHQMIRSIHLIFKGYS